MIRTCSPPPLPSKLIVTSYGTVARAERSRNESFGWGWPQVPTAADSKSTLGKIRSASQGQFTISDRDKNNPHIKKIRVVSTVAYYLSD